MKSNTGIQSRTVEISTKLPEEVESDALLLPWRGGEELEEAGGILQKAGPDVLEEILEYRGEREVMLTSAGDLPMRFLFHLTMPAEGKASLDILEERFRDCLFQAGVLGIREIAIPLLEYSSFVDSFSELVATVWRSCSEFVARERGPKRVLFLIQDRDLRGQYLRHFFNRKLAESEGWGMMDSSKQPVATIRPPGLPRPLGADYSQFETEKVFSPELADPEGLGVILDELLREYSEDRNYDVTLERMLPPMRSAFRHCIGGKEALHDLPSRLRVLGADSVLRLPWELIHERGTFIGEDHLFTRGTNFLHFNKDNRPFKGGTPNVSFRVAGGADAAREVGAEITELTERAQPELKWSEESEAEIRMLHCMGEDTARALLEQETPAYEIAFIDLESGDCVAGEPEGSLDELARSLLASGCRRVLVPLARFRKRQERQIYRRAFYDRLLSGAKAGEAHRYAQRALMEAFGAYSGWWLYRIFGQTDEAILPAGVQTGGHGRLRGGV
jgi:O-acetyl-ADP-ribose deacetylase (regulator of RNase III)